ncbi:hypothetical protein O3P69_011841 [Scylla paramamosain]|uniref:Nuclear receptor domain-containing protein n=1 Tax=Scylla paramamosain TaxID=85552 RepID=A0AAW0SFI6_SCYPA
MNQLCRVCGEAAAGFHFGAFTCEGCKSFFGRTYNNAGSLGHCKNGGRCVITKKNRTSCKACRLTKCLAAGMSKSGSRYGRRSNWFKIHCLLQDTGDRWRGEGVKEAPHKTPEQSPHPSPRQNTPLSTPESNISENSIDITPVFTSANPLLPSSSLPAFLLPGLTPHPSFLLAGCPGWSDWGVGKSCLPPHPSPLFFYRSLTPPHPSSPLLDIASPLPDEACHPFTPAHSSSPLLDVSSPPSSEPRTFTPVHPSTPRLDDLSPPPSKKSRSLTPLSPKTPLLDITSPLAAKQHHPKAIHDTSPLLVKYFHPYTPAHRKTPLS